MQPRLSSGFTLVEVVVALALLVVVTVGVVRLFAVALNAGRAARDRTLAVALATGKIEQLRSLEWRFELDASAVLTAAHGHLVEPEPRVGEPRGAGPGRIAGRNARHQRAAVRRLPGSAWPMGRYRCITSRECRLRPALGCSPAARRSRSSGRVAGICRDSPARTRASRFRSACVERGGRPARHADDAEGEVRATREAGFSLIEMLVATAILASAFVVLFQLAANGQRVARAQPDAADLRQRLRVAADMIQRDLLMAGAGLVHGADAGPLVNYLPAVLPMRTGARKADPELSFFDDRVSILYVEAGAASAPLTLNMPTSASDVPVDRFGPRLPVCRALRLRRWNPIADRRHVRSGFWLRRVLGHGHGGGIGPRACRIPICLAPIRRPVLGSRLSGSASTTSTLQQNA